MVSEYCTKFVWVISMVGEDEDLSDHVGSGVSIVNNRMLTCNHVVANIPSNLRIMGRRVKDYDSYEFVVAHTRQNWDLAILKLKDHQDVDFEYPNVSENEVIYAADKLFHFGNSMGQAGLFGFATVLYNCIKVNPTTFKTNLTLSDHQIDFSFCDRYCVMGDNNDFDNNFPKIIHPMLPTIEFYRSVAVGPGSSGGPLLRKNGELVGIFFGGCDLSSTAVHVSAVKEFLKEAENKELEASASGN